MTAAAEARRAPDRDPSSRRDQDIVARLHKASGQVAGIAGMYEKRRHPLEILDQLAAVTAAVDAVALMLAEDHVEHCVRAAVEDGAAEYRMSELTAAVRRYVRRR